MTEYSITTISVPGAASTTANGINDQGEVVGSYFTATGQEYGFIETTSGFVTISVPGAASVAARGINDAGAVVGSFTDATGATHGFLDEGGTITTVDVPGAVGTMPQAINDSGEIVGSFLAPKSATDSAAAGPATDAFADIGGMFTTLAVGTNDGAKGIVQYEATGVDGAGKVVGTAQYAPAALPEAWTWVGGTLETLAAPAGSFGAGATGIDNNGTIVGWYGAPGEATIPGGAAFVDAGGTLTLASLPGVAGGINDSGQIVGTAGSVGFLATPLAVDDPRDVAAPCLCAGTPVLTERGDVPVEALRPGDRVRTASGRLATVRWVGHRQVALRGLADPDGVVPVRIAAGALAPGLPRRVVWLSPDHAVGVAGLLIPAHRLVNGATIRRDARPARVTYVHVELDRHDLLLAEGMAVESYLDTGNRGQFDRECGVRPLAAARPADPLAAARAAYEAHGCAPLAHDGPAAAAAHRALVARAEALGWTRTDDPAPTLRADGVALAPQIVAEGMLTALLPPRTRTLRLRSRRFVPAEQDAGRPDGRRLGIAAVLHLDGAHPPAPAFGRGWHAAEGDAAWRWTDGDARLHLNPGPKEVRLDLRWLRCGAAYWVAPRAPALSGAGAAAAR